MPEQHALLSASSSHRWLHCPPSAQLAATFPDQDTAYTRAGTLAHKLAELKARKHFIEPMGARSYSAAVKRIEKSPDYDAGMAAATDMYLEHLKQIALSFESAPFVALETRVDYSHIAPNGFGTADCIMISGDQIHVVDYKNGAGVLVEAEHNPQMMLYALGALHVYGMIYGDMIQEVFLHIVQPNAGGVKSWSCSRAELEAWGETVKPIAQKAATGSGDYCPGTWCDSTFCPARATCRARVQKMLEMVPVMEEHPMVLSNDPMLTDDELGQILDKAGELQKWVAALQDYALSAALAGRKISGHKLVEGRGSRDWTDLDKAFAALTERGIPEAMLWERKPVSVAGLEKALGKKAFGESCTDLVVKKPGKPTLVPESDKRPVFDPAASVFSVIN